MPPAVAPAAEVRRPAAAVLVERRRHLGDPQPAEGRLDHDLARELHAGGLQVELENGLAVEAAQPAMEVADRRAEQHPADPDSSGLPRYLCSGGIALGDAALEAVAHHELVARAEPLDERRRAREVVAVVGIAHDDVLAAGGVDAAHQGAAVSRGTSTTRAPCARAMSCEPSVMPLSATITSPDAAALQEPCALSNADGKGLRLVEARHHDREFDRFGGGGHEEGSCRTRGRPPHRTEWCDVNLGLVVSTLGRAEPLERLLRVPRRAGAIRRPTRARRTGPRGRRRAPRRGASADDGVPLST